MKTKNFITIYADTKDRLDKFLEDRTDHNRSQVKKLIDHKLVLVNGKPTKAGLKLRGDEKIEIFFPEDPKIKPVKMDIEVLYEDDDLAIISKPKGIPVHLGTGTHDKTLVDGLLYRFENLSNPLDYERPGIIHRLDKDTEGLMIISKTERAYYELVQMLKDRKVQKKYLAFVHGKLDTNSKIDLSIGRDRRDRKKMAAYNKGYKNAKNAVTFYNIVENFIDYTLLSLDIETGRTHQIRVHMAAIGHPVLGDLTYGHKNKLGVNTQALQAYELRFIHPFKDIEMIFRDKMSSELKNILKKLRLEKSRVI